MPDSLRTVMQEMHQKEIFGYEEIAWAYLDRIPNDGWREHLLPFVRDAVRHSSNALKASHVPTKDEVAEFRKNKKKPTAQTKPSKKNQFSVPGKWARQLNDTWYIPGVGHKQLKDCTAADLRKVADMKITNGRASIAAGRRAIKLAEAVEIAAVNTFGQLTEEDMNDAFANAA